MTYEEHVTAALECIEQIQKHTWALSAVCASLEKSYGDGIVTKFASDIGYSAGYVRRLARTYKVWENEPRSAFLSFTHHAIAAEADDPVAAITKAEDEQMSTRELEEYVNPTPLHPLEEQGHGTVWMLCPVCDGEGRVWKDGEAS